MTLTIGTGEARDNLETFLCLVDRTRAELVETKVALDKAITTSLKVMADADEVLAWRM